MQGMTVIPLAVKKSFSGSSNTTHAIPETAEALSISNRGASDVTFTVNDISITVAAGETFSAAFRTFSSVGIVASDSYALVVMGR